MLEFSSMMLSATSPYRLMLHRGYAGFLHIIVPKELQCAHMLCGLKQHCWLWHC